MPVSSMIPCRKESNSIFFCTYNFKRTFLITMMRNHNSIKIQRSNIYYITISIT